MSYRENYEKWLHSPALSAAEKAELDQMLRLLKDGKQE